MIEENIKKLQKEIGDGVEIFLDEKIQQAKRNNMPDKFLEVVENVRSLMTRGGKRIRPVLFYYGYILAGGDPRRDIVSCSLAMEFLHVYFLIHDDIIDQDNMRHGGPSMHFKYEQDYEMEFPGRDAKHFGEAIALNVGDIVSSWSYEIIVDSDFDSNRKIEALRRFIHIDEETSVGQILDEFLEMGNMAEEDRIIQVQTYKTAKYSVAGPLQMGAILAGAGKAELDFIEKFAIPLGIAYQIRDDILGIFGNERETGKPVGSDIREGKKTLLISYALKNSSQEKKDFILQCLGDKNLSGENLTKVKEIIIDSGSLKYSEDKIEKLTEEFLRNLKSGDEKLVVSHAPLEDVANYLLKRTS